jgi:hypothetical protein
MTNVNDIKVYLNICDSVTNFRFRDQAYPAGHQGPINVGMQILEGDILEIEVPGHKNRAKIGNASEMAGVSIRVCKDKTSVIAVYHKAELSLSGCCACGPCGVCVYGSILCDPGC